ncbi:type II secretion system F family protein [Streptomyces sp. NPDC017979]|uniref:type II secretion system F family protein n=1 Tax=Streptomyces sp. NPDC017979 TaxID=3365024 RepID=UPI00379D67BA
MRTLEPVHAAALCAGAAALLLADGRSRAAARARVVLAGSGVEKTQPGWSWRRLWLRLVARVGREWWCVPVAVLLAVVGRSLLPLVAGAVAVPLVRRRLRGRARARSRDMRADEVIALCGSVAAELRAGLQPGQALLHAAGAGRALGAAEPAVIAAARFGGDVPAALREAAGEPGAEGLAGVAACWSVAVGGGAGLAAGLDRLEAALRAEREQEEDLRAQLAGARSTVVLLALLPVAALGIGTAVGADPLRVLLHTPVGLLCLLGGAVLETAGVCWAARIVRGARKEAP